MLAPLIRPKKFSCWQGYKGICPSGYYAGCPSGKCACAISKKNNNKEKNNAVLKLQRNPVGS